MTAICSTKPSTGFSTWKAKLALYRGGYPRFERQRRERQALDTQVRAQGRSEQAQAPAGLRRSLPGQGHQGTRRHSRASRLLAKLEPVAAPWSPRRCRRSKFRRPQRLLSPPIIALDDVSVGYEPGHPVLRRLDASHRRRRSHRASSAPTATANRRWRSSWPAGLKPMSGQSDQARQRLEIAYLRPAPAR